MDPKRSIEEDTTADAPGGGTPSTSRSTPGEVLAGRYEIQALVGVGGMGSVYRVLDRSLDETVALKMLRQDWIDAPMMLERFRQEVRLARRITHRNIARTFDIGVFDGGHFLTMEYVDGESLASHLTREGWMRIADAVDLARQMCEGLAAAHHAGVIHRDLKPENIMITKEGRVVIMDFGIARNALVEGPTRTAAGVVGTPAYMAPEQLEGRADIDGRADLYALGEVLYEALAGEPPWRGSTPFMLASARLTQSPPDPRTRRVEIPERLAALTRSLLARAREERPASAEKVLEELATMHVTAAPAPAPERPRGSVFPVAPDVAPAISVAVLPLHNGGPSDDDYVADGISEDLTDTLSMIDGLRVRPFGLTVALRGRLIDARAAGREIGVAVVVDGKVRRSTTGHRLTLRVTSVEDGFQLWAKRYERSTGELLQVCDEAAREIAAALTTQLKAPRRHAVTDPVAVELYLKARAGMHDAWHSQQAMEGVVAMFEEARARAPHDHLLMAGSALGHARLAFFLGATDTTTRRKAKELCDALIVAAPHQTEPWIALATLRRDEGDVVGAFEAARSALTASPRNARARELVGVGLLEANRLDEAETHLRAAFALEQDPTVVGPWRELSRLHALRGEWTEVDALLARPTSGGAAAHEFRTITRARFALWRAHGSSKPTYDVGEELEGPGLLAVTANMMTRVARTGTFDAADRATLDEWADRRGGSVRRLMFQIRAELALACRAPDHECTRMAVSSAIAAGLHDLAWLDHCPLLAALREESSWGPLRDRVAARVRPIRDAAFPE